MKLIVLVTVAVMALGVGAAVLVQKARQPAAASTSSELNAIETIDRDNVEARPTVVSAHRRRTKAVETASASEFAEPAPTKPTVDHNTLGRFPEPCDEELLARPRRNFQVFDALDFLAEVTQHIPDPGEHLIRYYGWYSNKSRGRRARGQPAAERPAQQQGPGGRDARKRWAALIQQVYEVDPLLCPKCGATMKTCPAVASSKGGSSASSNGISAT